MPISPTLPLPPVIRDIVNYEPPAPNKKMLLNELNYSLDKRVPDMLRGFTITTCYGEINIEPEFAEAFRNLAADVLQYQLNMAMNDQTEKADL